jgi:hypothetical protein
MYPNGYTNRSISLEWAINYEEDISFPKRYKYSTCPKVQVTISGFSSIICFNNKK